MKNKYIVTITIESTDMVQKYGTGFGMDEDQMLDPDLRTDTVMSKFDELVASEKILDNLPTQD